MFRVIGMFVLAGAMVLGSVEAAFAQRQAPAFGVSRVTPPQTVNLTFGWFMPKSADGRGEEDVLFANCDPVPSPSGECTFLDFDIDNLKSLTIGGEYLIPIGEYIEAGAGISFTKKTLDSRYAELVADDPNTPQIEEDDILQDLSLQNVPLAFTVRVLPLGATKPIQPYVGGGIGVILWKYKETGEFVDSNSDVFRDTFEDSGATVGPLILAGVRFALDSFSVGGEFRWQGAKADLDADQFFAPKVDLGGYTIQATFGVRFD